MLADFHIQPWQVRDYTPAQLHGMAGFSRKLHEQGEVTTDG